MEIKKFNIESNGNKIAATICIPNGKPSSALIRISGGYLSGHWPNDWQEILAKDGIINIGFDFTGVGDSTGDLSDTSLATRLEDARNVAKFFETQIVDGLIPSIFGVSMGAPIAIWLAEEIKFDSMVIAVPAAYPRSSYDKNFGEDFSKVIRVDGAWESSDEFDKLEKLDLPILMISAKQDQVIPKGIIDRYKSVLYQKGFQSIEFDVPHQFLRQGESSPEIVQSFWTAVSEFIATNSST